MHNSAFESFRKFKKVYLDKLNKNKELKLVEIGSMAMGSTVKSLLNQDKIKYIGLDIAPGPNVDCVITDPYKYPFEENSIDIVVSISTFEHTDFFWLSFLEILRILKPEGLFFLNAPSNSHFHRHPVDSWRFYPDSSYSLVKWGKKNNYNCSSLEHYTNHETGRDIWNDFVSIIIKDKKFNYLYPNRIINYYMNFTNGRINDDKSFINFAKIPQDQNNFGWKIYYKLRRRFWKIKNLLKLSD